jgi:gamma-glutamyl:cysteine ligase YbdK (ATP-grasp superfamily)
MGIEIDRPTFEPGDYERFGDRLRDCVAALASVLARPGFGHGETTIGAELELHLVDAHARPSPVNRTVMERTADRRVTLELDRFNLEINADPTAIAGHPFSALRDQIDDVISAIERAAAGDSARVVAIGILPTIEEADLSATALTEGHRYAALSSSIRHVRGGPVPVRISGEDVLDLTADDVTLEGANTSFQIHLRVAPEDFARTYNAAQLAAAPALALAANSPLFLGRRLWEETRIALFRQSVDDRPDAEPDDWRPARVSFGHGWVRRSALELFTEAVSLHEPLLPLLDESESPLAIVRAGGVPSLRELRLHCGTVWRWNRAVYDGAAGGHLRIEMRALPAGPSTKDMVANAAFAVGLTLGLASRADDLVDRVTFGQARRNFYQAARFGHASELIWPEASRARPIAATQLAGRLLPIARDGLVGTGVDPAEADAWLAIIEKRIERRMTGSQWQRACFQLARSRGDVREASRVMLERYMALSAEGRPVAEWPAPG